LQNNYAHFIQLTMSVYELSESVSYIGLECNAATVLVIEFYQ